MTHFTYALHLAPAIGLTVALGTVGLVSHLGTTQTAIGNAVDG